MAWQPALTWPATMPWISTARWSALPQPGPWRRPIARMRRSSRRRGAARRRCRPGPPARTAPWRPSSSGMSTLRTSPSSCSFGRRIRQCPRRCRRRSCQAPSPRRKASSALRREAKRAWRRVQNAASARQSRRHKLRWPRSKPNLERHSLQSAAEPRMAAPPAAGPHRRPPLPRAVAPGRPPAAAGGRPSGRCCRGGALCSPRGG
mmetsp:Transcript_46247/g.133216  ORF Transcript_46247/g.133216 Transcript_46247/m.133216 type:complete len:205 (-) Transcript_46247:121-735(-)